MFSVRSECEPEQNALSASRARLERAGVPFHDLTLGNPTTLGLPFDAARILAALAQPGALRYEPEALGPLNARHAVSELWRELGVQVGPERVLLTASTSEAYALLFKLLCDPGDEILVPAPSYPLFEHLARFEGVRAVPYELGFDGAWFLDFDALERARSPRSRAVVVVSPNNPTGHYLEREELRRLGDTGLPLISDEVFESYALNRPATAVRTALEAPLTLTFALSGLSKLAALPQMKLAWTTLGGPPHEVEQALARLEFLADAYLSPSAPVLLALPELLASRALQHAALLERLHTNVRLLTRATADSLVSLLPVEGGWYAVLRLPRILSEEAWVLGLLSDAHVLVQPGYFYDFRDGPYVVVSLLVPEAELETALAALVDYVAQRAR